MATKRDSPKKFFLLFCVLLSLNVMAEKESVIHSETGIDDEPVNTKSEEEGKQEEQARPMSDSSDFQIGPFDRNGKFNHRTKKEDKAPGT